MNRKMEAILLSKRRPQVQKLLGKRLKMNFSNLPKKFWTIRSSLHQTSRPDIFQKNHPAKIKKNIQISGGFGSNYSFLRRPLEKKKYTFSLNID